MDFKHELTKRWRYRLWVWLAGVMVVVWAWAEYPPGVVVAVVGVILTDEVVKEGYLFKPSDVKKPFTHEWILAVVAMIWAVIEAVRLRRRGGND